MEMARQNWFFYVSNTQAYFDLSYIFYKNLFASQTKSNLLKTTHYFGPEFSSKNTIHPNLSSRKAPDIPKEVQLAFQAMVHKITNYLNQSNSNRIADSINTPLNIVSSISQSSFLKKNIHLNSIRHPSHNAKFLTNQMIPIHTREKQLMTLYQLFSAVDTNISIEPFYDNWDREIRLAQEKVLIEKSIQWAATCNQALEFIKRSQPAEQLRKENNELFLQRLSQSENSKDTETTLNNYLSNIEIQQDVLSICSQQKIKIFSLSDTSEQLIKDALEKQIFITDIEAKKLFKNTTARINGDKTQKIY